MGRLFENHYLDAGAKTIFFAGIFHVSTSMLYAILKGDYKPINVFNLIGVSLFIPQSGEGPFSFIVSLLLTSSVYVGIFLTLCGHNKKNK